MGVYKSGVAFESHDQSLEVLQNARTPSSKMKRSRKRARSQTDGWETALQLLPDPEGCLICVHPETLCLGQGSLLPAVIHAHKGFWDLNLNLQRYFHGKRSRRLQESQWASVFLSGQIQNFEEWLEVTLEDVYYIFFKLGRDVYIWSLLLNCGLNSTVWKLLNLKEKKKKGKWKNSIQMQGKKS